jgi:hypothetical protein
MTIRFASVMGSIHRHGGSVPSDRSNRVLDPVSRLWNIDQSSIAPSIEADGGSRARTANIGR